MNQSYWEKYILPEKTDLLIIGSGIVGMTCAIQAKMNNPKLCITILERGVQPFGATTRNAGFACFGSVSEIVDDLRHMDDTDVYDLIKQRWDGLQLLQNLLTGYDIGFENNGGFEIFTEELSDLFLKCEHKMPSINQRLFDLFGKKVFKLNNKLIGSFGFNNVSQIIANPFESQIHSGKLTSALMKVTEKLGINQLFGANVTNINELNQKVVVQVNNHFELICNKLVIATNGFTSELIPNIEVKATRAQVLLTAPVKNLRIKGCFHMDRGYYYFRNIDDRILFGGARNLDIQNEYTSETDTTSIIQNDLESKLSSIILPHNIHSVDMRWSGIMGTGSIKAPIVEHVSDQIIAAVRLGGMGIAIGSLVGKKAARLAIS